MFMWSLGLLEITLRSYTETRRGVPLSVCLSGFGRYFESYAPVQGQVSEPTREFNAFISHDWQTSRWLKLMCLLVLFNSRAAVIGALLVSITVGLFCGVEYLPDSDVLVLPGCLNRSAATSQEVVIVHSSWSKKSAGAESLPGMPCLSSCCASGSACAMSAARVPRFSLTRGLAEDCLLPTQQSPYPKPCCFQLPNTNLAKQAAGRSGSCQSSESHGQAPTSSKDKLCINQADPAQKKLGILGLGAFLKASQKLVILWSPRWEFLQDTAENIEDHIVLSSSPKVTGFDSGLAFGKHARPCTPTAASMQSSICY